MAFFGALDKSGCNPLVVKYLNIPCPKATCQPAIEDWFALFVFACPCAFLIAIIALIKSRGQQNLHHYTFEAFCKEFLIYTTDHKFINWTILLLEALHLLWSIAGSILNSSLDYESGGAIGDCAYDYGTFAPVMAFTCLVMGYACVLRAFFFAAHFVWHR